MTDNVGIIQFTCKKCNKKHKGTLVDGGIIVLTVNKVQSPSSSETKKKTITLLYTCPVDKVEETYDLSVPVEEANRYQNVELTGVTVVE